MSAPPLNNPVLCPSLSSLLQVLEETKDPKGGRKVKVVGVMVADEKGADSDKVGQLDRRGNETQ
jgi:hypothetical protein